MARMVLYKYEGDEKVQQHSAAFDPDDSMPIPVKGDIIKRKGKTWRVDSVTNVITMGPSRYSQPPRE
jgi:hypothetical protein